MEEQRPGPSPRRRGRIGVVTGVIAVSLLGTCAVAAQSPSPDASPAAGTQPPTTRMQQHPNRGRWYGGGRGYDQPGDRSRSGWPGMPGDGNGFQRGWPGMPGDGNGFQRGWPGMPGDGNGFQRGGTQMPRNGQIPWRIARTGITVSAITAPVMTLTTDDGWTRDVDTTNVAITRNGAAITLADVNLGDHIRLGQTRNDDGTWTVNRIDVQMAVVQGTVASVGTDSFTVTQADGSTATVSVSDTTRWVARRGTTAGLAGLAIGAWIVAQGVRAADGSVQATLVAVRATAPIVPTSPSADPSPVTNQG